MTIDTAVHLGHWPFRRHGYEDTARLVAKLRSLEITEAWAGSFDALLHKDLAGVNARLAEECRAHGGGLLVPFGTVNPTQPDWEEDLRRCHEDLRMRGVRLYPNYHGYNLDAPAFRRLLHLAMEAKLLVQVVLKMEDDRTHHPLVKAPTVAVEPLPAVLAGVPGLRLHLVNARISPDTEELVPLVRSGKVYFDFAMLEGIAAPARLVDRVGADRVVFATHFPLLIAESSVLKLKEAGLPADVERAVRVGNARGLLRK